MRRKKIPVLTYKDVGINRIELTDEECAIAWDVGGRRFIEEMKKRRTSKDYDEPNNYYGECVKDDSIEGAAAEKALCLFKGIEWSESVNTYKAPDVLDNVQVKFTRSKSMNLVYRPYRKNPDSPDHYYVLVLGKMPEYYIMGWMLGRECKTIVEKANPSQGEYAHFVHYNLLNDMSLLDFSGSSAREIKPIPRRKVS